MDRVWIFSGRGGPFPGGVFPTVELAESWIEKHGLTGVLTAYPLGVGCFDWAEANQCTGLSEEKLRIKRTDPDFIGSFSTAAQDHLHYEGGLPLEPRSERRPVITGTLTFEDHLEAQHLHRRTLSRWMTVGGALLLACGALLVKLDAERSGDWFLLAGFILLVAEVATARLQLPRLVRKLHSQQRDLASPFTYSWSAEGIEAQSTSGSAKRPWTHYLKVKENDRIVLLYHSDHMFEVLPKSWFPTPAALDEFLLLSKRTPRT